MHGHLENSRAPRALLITSHTLLALFVCWFLLAGGDQTLAQSFGYQWPPGNQGRKIVLAIFSLIYMARTHFGFLVLLKRRFAWPEALIVLGLFTSLQLSFAFLGSRPEAALNALDYLAIAFYLLGSYFNTGSEYFRHVWKKDPANKGKLYTEGLFAYSMHINYFGDTLLFTGFAMLTLSPWAFIAPAVMTVGFIFQHIPQLDTYLAERYQDQFEPYARTTKKFIPYIY